MAEENKGRCPNCKKEETFSIYFGEDDYYKKLEYRRCMKCDKIFVEKLDIKKE